MATCEICKKKYFSKECPDCFLTEQKYKPDVTYKKKFDTKKAHMSEDNSNNVYIKKENYINVTEIAKHYLVSARAINKIFEDMELIEKQNKWILATELGKQYGAKEKYDAKNKIKYVVWEEKIINNIEIKNKINNKNNKTKMNLQEKKEKGNTYEEYIASFFREQGYYVWEHGKEKGVKDSSIDLLVKKDKFVYFIQCKNWENWKITHKEVKATRTDVREYLKEQKTLWQLIKNYESKILYITPKKCLTKAAYKYIEENKNIVEYQIIPIK